MAALAVWMLVSVAICGVTASRAYASITVHQPDITMKWARASGPVAGYAVYLAWNGGRFPSTPSFTVAGAQASMKLKSGDSVQIRVAAYDAAMNYGALSSASTRIRYVAVASSVATSATTGSPPVGLSPSRLLWRRLDTSSIAVLDPRTRTTGTLPIDANWDVEVSGDFNGDGSSDLLLRSIQGQNAILWMQGASMTGRRPLPPLRTGCWVAAVGSFNGDASDDLVWSCENGDHRIWLLTQDGVRNAVNLPEVDPGWAIKAAGDFDGDGHTDLVWQNLSSGVAGVWMMRGAKLARSVALPVTSANWQIVGLGDLDGDGQADLLWQDANSRRTALWLMAKGTLETAVSTAKRPKKSLIHDVTDVDGDGHADVIWAGLSSYRVWFMNGAKRTSAKKLVLR